MPGVVPATTLARTFTDLTPMLVWLGVLIAVTVVAGIVLLALRRSLLAPPSSREGALSGLMDDLRAMHARGDLTDDEFAAAKRRMVEKIREASTSQNADDPSKNPT
ncbi:MAG: SHOCT domain-containing protein [Phycisphaerales bacterium]